MIRRRLGQVLMVIALAFAAVSTAPVHAQEPAPITDAGHSDRGNFPAALLLDSRRRQRIKAHVLVHGDR